MLLADFIPSKLVQFLHQVPRGGFPNDISTVFGEEWLEYLLGIISASSLVPLLCILWATILLVLKVTCGPRRVGCAAGGFAGGAINIRNDWSSQLTKSQRKRRIRRHWRLQTVALLLVGGLIAPLNYVLLQWGLRPIAVGNAGAGIVDVYDAVDSLAYRALHVTESLQKGRDQLTQSVAPYKNEETIWNRQDIALLCPGFHGGRLLEDVWRNASNSPSSMGALGSQHLEGYISNATSNGNATDSSVPAVDALDGSAIFDVINLFIQWQESAIKGVDVVTDSFAHVESAETVLYQTTNATDLVEQAFDLVLEYDWVLKMALLILDVIVVFWTFAIVVAQNSIDWPALHRIAASLFLPVLCLLFLFFLLATLVVSGATLVNADFCAGTETEPSPLGVFQSAFAAEEGSSQIMEYYRSDCLAENPFQELSMIELSVVDTEMAVNNILVELNAYADEVPSMCNIDGSMVSAANETLYEVQDVLHDLKGNIGAIMKLSECSNVGPILRRLLYGTPCDEFMRSLIFLCGSLMAATVFVLIIFTTRAVVFNPIIAGRRCKRREKEFEDYKLYMSQFYDTKEWTLDFVPADKDEVPSIRRTNTGSTASPTASDDSDTVVAQAFEDDGPTSPLRRDVTRIEKDDDDSSYDSTYSADDDEDNATAFSSMSLMFSRHRASLADSMSTMSNATSVLGQKWLASMLFVKDRYSHPIDETPEEEQEVFDNDTAFGTDSLMLTPQPIRYTARCSARKRRRQQVNEDIDGLMMALSPNAKSPPGRY